MPAVCPVGRCYWLSAVAQADMGRGELHLDPVMEASTQDHAFQTFWSTGLAWGTFTQSRDGQTGDWQYDFKVLGGDADNLKVIANHQEIPI